MRINQSYLLFLLLASLSASCTSDCPITYDNSAKVYSILETALLENPSSLYELHDFFFSSFSSEPVYTKVTYELNGYGGFSSCWTSSVLLRSMDPVILTTLQLQLLNTLLETVGVSDLTADDYSGVQLSLELFNVEQYSNDSSCSYMIMNAVVPDLTPWVSA